MAKMLKKHTTNADFQQVFECMIASLDGHFDRYALLAVNSGATLYQVQHLLGHASSQTTQRYAHLADSTLREVSVG